jgi:hypothetical protein
MREGAYAHAGRCVEGDEARGGLEGDEARVVGTAWLAVVVASAGMFHECPVHFVAVLVQGVEDVPAGVADNTVAVIVAVGELCGDRVPVGALDYAAPVGLSTLVRAGVGGAIRTRVHAHVAAVDAVVD